MKLKCITSSNKDLLTEVFLNILHLLTVYCPALSIDNSKIKFYDGDSIV